MKFEDAQDIAYRFAQAAYLRKLRKLVGENEIIKLADSQSRHTAMLIAGDKAFSIQVAISCGRAVKVDSLEDAIKKGNKIVLPGTGD